MSEAGSKDGRYAFLALGAVGGVLVGRFLPTLFANACGMARGAAGRDPFAGLIRQHSELLSLLAKMEKTPAESPIKRFALFWRFKRTIGKHALAEEDIVYPLLRTEAERREATEKLYREHASMKVHLFQLERSIKDQEGWLTHVRTLRNEIEPHARQEEEVEFPLLKDLLNQHRNTELARKIDMEESLIV